MMTMVVVVVINGANIPTLIIQFSVKNISSGVAFQYAGGTVGCSACKLW